MRGSASLIPSILQTTSSSASRLSSSIPKSLALSIMNSLDKFTSSILYSFLMKFHYSGFNRKRKN